MNQCPVTEKGNINSRSTKKVERRKLEKVFENPHVIKTPVVRNGKQSTLGYLERMEIMVKKTVKDPLFLAQKLLDATEKDKQVVTDLLDTLRANLDHCNGSAAALATTVGVLTEVPVMLMESIM